MDLHGASESQSYKNRAASVFQRLQHLHGNSSDLKYRQNQQAMSEVWKIHSTYQHEMQAKQQLFCSVLQTVSSIQKELEEQEAQKEREGLKLSAAITQVRSELDNSFARVNKEAKKRENSLQTAVEAKIKGFELRNRLPDPDGYFETSSQREILAEIRRSDPCHSVLQEAASLRQEAKKKIEEFTKIVTSFQDHSQASDLKAMLEGIAKEFTCKIACLRDERLAMENTVIELIEKTVMRCLEA